MLFFCYFSCRLRPIYHWKTQLLPTPAYKFLPQRPFFSGILFLMSIWLLRVILRSSTLLRSLKAMEGERGLASVGIVEENRRKIFG